MNKGEKLNPHVGHRERMKQRCLDDGLDNFADHEALELLLFYAVPYRDVNELAHRLLEHFGTFSQVLDADYHDLLHIPGVGRNVALLLSTLPEFFRRYQLDKQRPKTALHSAEEAGCYVADLFIGCTCERFYVVCLNVHHQVTHTVLLNEGALDQVAVSPRRVAEVAMRYQAAAVLLAHNHPGGALRPSSDDVQLTMQLEKALSGINVPVVDHLIAAGSRYVSFAQMGLLRGGYQS